VTGPPVSDGFADEVTVVVVAIVLTVWVSAAEMLAAYEVSPE